MTPSSAADASNPGEAVYGSPSNEITFSVLETFTHDSFDLRRRSVRARDENWTEICAVQSCLPLQKVFLGLSSGDILALDFDFTVGQLQNAPVQVLQEHSGAVHCLGILQPEGVEAKVRRASGDSSAGCLSSAAEHSLPGLVGGPSLPRGSSVEERMDCWLVSGSSDRSLKLWSLNAKDPAVAKTLVGHSGTVVALHVQIPFLFSAATDGALFIWAVDLKSKQIPVLTLLQKYVGGNLVPASKPPSQGFKRFAQEV